MFSGKCCAGVRDGRISRAVDGDARAGSSLDVAKFPVSMLAALKKLDLPVEVRESKLVLIDDWACASKGSPLTASQAKMLFHLDMRVHEFKPSILASYVDGVVGD